MKKQLIRESRLGVMAMATRLMLLMTLLFPLGMTEARAESWSVPKETLTYDVDV